MSATLFVDAQRPDDSGSGSNWATAKRTIQSAIDIAENGDDIVVADGSYTPISTDNKSIVIESVNGAEHTIIDGNNARRCATLGNESGQFDTVLKGFTLQNGTASFHDYPQPLYYGYGGGALLGTLRNCILQNNKARAGGGAFFSAIYNSQVRGNNAEQVGGGTCEGIAVNCLITDNNSGGQGAGVLFSTLINCTVTKNRGREHAVYESHCTNCIIWDNKYFYGPVYNHTRCTITHSCTSPLPSGSGNTNSDPQFYNAASGDYRLWFDSPCRNSGNNTAATEEFDIEGNLRIQEGVVNMGAYESIVDGVSVTVKTIGKGSVTPAYFKGLPGEDVTFTAQPGPRTFIKFLTNGVFASTSPSFAWNNIQGSGELTAVFGDLYVDAKRLDNSGDGTSWATAKQSLQSAIEMTIDGETIWVADGLYTPIATDNMSIVIRSVNGAAETVIDGKLKSRCAALGSALGMTNSVLIGFTLQNGQTPYSSGELGGGGVAGGTLFNCMIVDNISQNNGAGASYSTLINCILAGNHADWSYGAGAYSSKLINCTVTENTGIREGVGVYNCAVTNSIVWGNMYGDASRINNHASSIFEHSCTTPLPQGSGNIDSDPQFTDTFNRLFTLTESSPCFDIGTNTTQIAEMDFRGQHRIQNKSVDLGAYERSAEQVIVTCTATGRGAIHPSGLLLIPAGSPLTCSATNNATGFLHFLTNGVIATTQPLLQMNAVDRDTTIEAIYAPSNLYVNAARPDNSGDGTTLQTAKRTIQAAVEAAFSGDTIHVTNGVYSAISTGNKKLLIQSCMGADSTIINGGASNCCATLGFSNLHRSTEISGFTLTNGRLGGAVMFGVANRCRITGNGTYDSEAAIRSRLSNSIIYGNAGTVCGGEQINCTIWNNSLDHVKLRNCILDLVGYYDSFDSYLLAEYCCFGRYVPSSWNNSNIIADPMLVDPTGGDFRIRSGSLCANSGNNAWASSDTDYAGNPRIQENAVDMGALEGSADVVILMVSARGHGSVVPSGRVVAAPGSNLTFTATATGIGFSHFTTNGYWATSALELTLPDVRRDMTMLAVFSPETIYVDAARPDDLGDGWSWGSAKKTTQAATIWAKEDDTIIVTNGVYQPFTTFNYPIEIKSVNGAAATVVDGGNTSRCATLDSNCTVTSLTFRNGLSYEGGGVFQGTLNGCILLNNRSTGNGGGASISLLNKCVLTGNTAGFAGGGAYGSTLNNCLITGNNAQRGGGAALSHLLNCTVIDNAAIKSGGGYFDDGISKYDLINCILWMNRLSSGLPDNYVGGTFKHSCSIPLPPGPGNISTNPQLINPNTGDYSLALSSPCIDAGTNVLTLGATDLAGAPRMNNAVVDMGAYEFNLNQSTETTPVRVPFTWLRQYPSVFKTWGTDYEGACLADNDGDNMATWQEYVAGTVPTNALSFFKVVIPKINGRIYVHWQPDLTNAIPSRRYSILGAAALADGFTDEPVTNIPGR